ncbi:hypothetical protein MASR2M70_06000 [Bacillota bacterium]
MRKFQSRLLLILLVVLIAVPANTGIEFSFAGAIEEKYFSQMTQDEKTRVLNDLIAKKVVPNTVKVATKNYSLNISNWNARGVITYGEMSAVNAANLTTNFPNYKDGEWRYLGYDMNGGLYGNDDFPPDYPSNPNPQNQTWLTRLQVTGSGAAKNLIGGTATVSADGGYSSSDKLYTASIFLDKNPKWKTAGWTAQKITDHFFFNAVLSDNGLTQGQFIGVKNIGSAADPVFRYQTFSVKVTVKFVIPPAATVVPDPVLPTDPDPEPEVPVIPPPPPGPNITVNCQLGLPAVTYAGHPALASDYSVFNVDGESWSAARTYSEGRARNRFRAMGESGSARKIASTSAEVTFMDPGRYSVELEVTPDGGSSATDVKSIEVKPTPTIIHALTGTQKQNRKQVINLKIAKNPASTLTEFWVKLEYLDKGESVTLHHKAAGGNTLSNSAHIKTRAIEKLPASDMYYEYCKLEFLLKNTEAANCRYTVFVKDSKGNTDQAIHDFTVSPDRPPKAGIMMDGAFIRKANSNIAEAVAEDASTTDGDQAERTWFYRAVRKDQTEGEKGPWIQIKTTDPGYMDYSFGTGKKVGFSKTGVGLFEVKLIVRDLWTEETLSEYVSQSDRLSSEAVAGSEIINIAPVVGLKPISVKTAGIIILAGGDHEYATVKQNQGRIEADLLQRGIDARITVEKMLPNASENAAQGAAQTLEIETPFGYEGSWLFYNDSNYIVDDEHFYKIDASWPNTGPKGYPASPYTISCWRFDAGGTNDKKWTLTFTDNILKVPVIRSGPYFAQDDMGKYLFFIASGKTMILSKDNGSLLSVIDFEIGKNTYVEDNYIYTMKSDGIYRISTMSGHVANIYKTPVIDGVCKRLNGQIHFVTGSGNKIFRGIFNLARGKVQLQALPLNYTELGPKSHKVLSIDTDGQIVLTTLIQERQSPTGYELRGQYYILKTTVFDRDNATAKTMPDFIWSRSSDIYTSTPVHNEEGKCNYVVYTQNVNDSATASLISTNGSYNKYVPMYDGNRRETRGDLILFARETKGVVYICTGAYMVNLVYPHRTKAFVFDPGNNTVATGAQYIGDLGITYGTFENGYSSDVIGAIQAGYNTAGNAFSRNQIIKWKQTLPAILNRYLKKNLQSDNDTNALVIFDKTNPQSMYNPELINSLNSKAEARKNKLLIATQNDITGNGLFDAIVDEENREENVLKVSVEGESKGALSKLVRLSPGKTYYYEYEILTAAAEAEDILSIKAENTPTAGAVFSPGGYKTVSTQVEDFEDADNTNPFFSFANKTVNRYYGLTKVIDEGHYKGADLVIYREKSNGYGFDPGPGQTDIFFTVPEGQQGALSFDYFIMKYYLSSWMQSYVKIDGVLWDAFIPGNHKGHYSHPYLLSPGTHTISFYTSQYGRQEYSKLWLDSIRVDLLEQTDADLPNDIMIENSRVEHPSGSGAKVSGSFTASPKIPAYGNPVNSTAVDGPIGPGTYTLMTQNDRYGRRFEFQLPPGKTAINTLIKTSTLYANNGQARFNYLIPGPSYNEKYRWTVYSDTQLQQYGPSARLADCPNDYVINPGILNAPIIMEALDHGYFDNMSSVIVDNANAGWQNSDFFLAGSGANRKYFMSKATYDKTRLTFSFPKGQHVIRDFKLYTIENGVKVFAEEEAFSDSATLSKWTVSNASAAIIKEAVPGKRPEDKGLVYKKGEKILYGISYFDYEGDPSKKQYWKYTHTPFNDGPHPDAAVILNADAEPVEITGKVMAAPIDRFYLDGKYTVEHWQEDNTARPPAPAGNPDYDKLSNVVSLTFYVEGGGSAPWVESIRTIPAVVKEGDNFRLQIAVDDTEKDELRLTTEVFYEKELIYIHKKSGIKADASGKYLPVLTDSLPETAASGKYEVVCTVRDLSGAGIGSYRFTVVSEGKIIGRICHTDEWEANRKKYNLHFFSEEYNNPVAYADYSSMKPPRKRGTNVFWSGERFLFSADVGGNPVKVTAEIDGSPAYKAILSNTGRRNAQNEMIFIGELWDRNMINRWGRNKPEELKFLFKAEYSGGAIKTYEDRVIIDSNTDYWLLHRLW